MTKKEMFKELKTKEISYIKNLKNGINYWVREYEDYIDVLLNEIASNKQEILKLCNEKEWLENKIDNLNDEIDDLKGITRINGIPYKEVEEE